METNANAPVFPDLNAVIDWPGFTSADQKYRALVSTAEKENEGLTKALEDFPSSSRLSEMESAAFDIKVHDIPGLHWAYWRYQSLIGQNETYFGDFCDQERRDHARFFRGLGEWNFHDAVGFMTSVCGLSRPKSVGWVCKELGAQIRCGAIS